MNYRYIVSVILCLIAFSVSAQDYKIYKSFKIKKASHNDIDSAIIKLIASDGINTDIENYVRLLSKKGSIRQKELLLLDKYGTDYYKKHIFILYDETDKTYYCFRILHCNTWNGSLSAKNGCDLSIIEIYNIINDELHIVARKDIDYYLEGFKRKYMPIIMKEINRNSAEK